MRPLVREQRLHLRVIAGHAGGETVNRGKEGQHLGAGFIRPAIRSTGAPAESRTHQNAGDSCRLHASLRRVIARDPVTLVYRRKRGPPISVPETPPAFDLLIQQVETNRLFQFDKGRKLFIGAYNKELSVAMCVSNPD